MRYLILIMSARVQTSRGIGFSIVHSWKKSGENAFSFLVERCPYDVFQTFLHLSEQNSVVDSWVLSNIFWINLNGLRSRDLATGYTPYKTHFKCWKPESKRTPPGPIAGNSEQNPTQWNYRHYKLYNRIWVIFNRLNYWRPKANRYTMIIISAIAFDTLGI